ncbi:MAG TPA: hemolysin family protein [Bryobacteraceae bacterium]|nr:hemolysin family protein [Bryobacteraceae bacterium]
MTTVLLLVVMFVGALLLVHVTLVQMLYMDTVRLRARELPFLEMFRSGFDERLGLKPDEGILTFSLVKHTMLALVGAITYQVTGSLLEACLMAWAAMLLLTYIVPQFLYRRTSGKWFVSMVPLTRGLIYAVRPLTAFLGFLQSLAQLGETGATAEEPSTQQENVEALITAGTEEGIIEEEDRRLIHSVVAFGNKTVREVMTARPAIVAISAASTLEDLRQLVIHEQYSRIPVYEGSIDQILGFIHVRDMFELDHTERLNHTVRELVRPIRFVPETKPVNDLLREMQQDGNHIAAVVDEYGNTAGLVTMEDMVEEIVGEIRDEHEPGLDVEVDSGGGYIVSGSFDVDHLHDLVEFRKPEDSESTTVGGLVTEWLGRVPEVGETIEREGVRIEVLGGNELRVDQVRISRAEPANSNGE